MLIALGMPDALRLRPKEKLMAKNGTVAYVIALPKCDICKYIDMSPPEDQADAEYDVLTITGQWGNVCPPHRKTHARYPNRLGVGIGQKLEVRTGTGKKESA